VGGHVGRGDSTGTDRSRGLHVGLRDSTGSHRSGGRHVGLSDSTGTHRRGAVLLGSGAPLATPPPSRQPQDAIAIHATPHVRDSPHEGCTEGGGSGDEEGAPAPPPPTTDETRSYLDLYLDTCRVRNAVVFSCLLFHIYSIDKNQKLKSKNGK
jgi:hypothetical protein